MPGYDEKVEFGVLVEFAYRVEGSGKLVIHILVAVSDLALANVFF